MNLGKSPEGFSVDIRRLPRVFGSERAGEKNLLINSRETVDLSKSKYISTNMYLDLGQVKQANHTEVIDTAAKAGLIGSQEILFAICKEI